MGRTRSSRSKNPTQVASSPGAAVGPTALGAFGEEEQYGVPTVGGDTAPSHVAETVRLSENERRLIAARAYELFLARGGQGGDELADWLEAERQVKGHTGD